MKNAKQHFQKNQKKDKKDESDAIVLLEEETQVVTFGKT